jgi:hypothetical protein
MLGCLSWSGWSQGASHWIDALWIPATQASTAETTQSHPEETFQTTQDQLLLVK